MKLVVAAAYQRLERLEGFLGGGTLDSLGLKILCLLLAGDAAEMECSRLSLLLIKWKKTLNNLPLPPHPHASSQVFWSQTCLRVFAQVLQSPEL